MEPGTPGELLLRGPMVTRGYFDNPKATVEAFHEGWFRTGDIGVFKNEKFYVVDRKKVNQIYLSRISLHESISVLNNLGNA